MIDLYGIWLYVCVCVCVICAHRVGNFTHMIVQYSAVQCSTSAHRVKVNVFSLSLYLVFVPIMHCTNRYLDILTSSFFMEKQCCFLNWYCSSGIVPILLPVSSCGSKYKITRFKKSLVNHRWPA